VAQFLIGIDRLKQTIDKRKLRCRNPERLLAELDWSLLGMAFAELIALRSQIPAADKEKNSTYAPKDRSLAKTLKVLRRHLRNLDQKVSPNTLKLDLEGAFVQKYKKSTDKRSRNRPPNPDKKPLGNPTVSKLTPEQKRKLKEIDLAAAACKCFTALLKRGGILLRSMWLWHALQSSGFR